MVVDMSGWGVDFLLSVGVSQLAAQSAAAMCVLPVLPHARVTGLQSCTCFLGFCGGANPSVPGTSL